MVRCVERSPDPNGGKCEDQINVFSVQNEHPSHRCDPVALHSKALTRFLNYTHGSVASFLILTRHLCLVRRCSPCKQTTSLFDTTHFGNVPTALGKRETSTQVHLAIEDEQDGPDGLHLRIVKHHTRTLTNIDKHLLENNHEPWPTQRVPKLGLCCVDKRTFLRSGANIHTLCRVGVPVPWSRVHGWWHRTDGASDRAAYYGVLRPSSRNLCCCPSTRKPLRAVKAQIRQSTTISQCQRSQEMTKRKGLKVPSSVVFMRTSRD